MSRPQDLVTAVQRIRGMNGLDQTIQGMQNIPPTPLPMTPAPAPLPPPQVAPVADPRVARLQQLNSILDQRIGRQQPWWQAGLTGMMRAAGAVNPEQANRQVMAGAAQDEDRRQNEIQNRLKQINLIQADLDKQEADKQWQTREQIQQNNRMELEKLRMTAKPPRKIGSYTGADNKVHLIMQVPDASDPSGYKAYETDSEGEIRPYRSFLSPGSKISVTDARQTQEAFGQQFLDANGTPIDLSKLDTGMELIPYAGGMIGRYQVSTQNRVNQTAGNINYAVPALERDNPAANVPLGPARVGTVSAPQQERMIGGEPYYVPGPQTTTSPQTTGMAGAPPMNQAQPRPMATPQMPAYGGASPVGAAPPMQVTPPPSATPQAAPTAPVRRAAPQGPPVVRNQAPPLPPGVPQGAVPAYGLKPEEVQRQRTFVTPIKTAASQLFGDKNNPDFESMSAFADIADSKDSRERLGKAARLIMGAIAEGDQKADGVGASVMGYGAHINTGGILAGIKNELGLTGWVEKTKVDMIERAVNDLSPREQRFLNRAFSSYGTIAGLRNLNKGSAMKFNMEAMNRELPIPGLTGVNSSQSYYDKLASLAEEITSALDGAQISRQMLPQADEYRTSAATLARLGRGMTDQQKINPFKNPPPARRP